MVAAGSNDGSDPNGQGALIASIGISAIGSLAEKMGEDFLPFYPPVMAECKKYIVVESGSGNAGS